MGEKLLIFGSRTLRDYNFLKEKVDDFCERHRLTIDVVISGGQVSLTAQGEKYGTDYLGEQWARERKIRVEKFPADWKKHGHKAGFLRNKEMRDVGKPDYAIGFAGLHVVNKGTMMMARLLEGAPTVTELIWF